MGCSGTTDTGPAPIGLAVFSGGRLRFFDPLAALLLFIKPRVGIILTAAIILADVAHNTYYVALNQQWLEPFYLSQVAFLCRGSSTFAYCLELHPSSRSTNQHDSIVKCSNEEQRRSVLSGCSMRRGSYAACHDYWPTRVRKKYTGSGDAASTQVFRSSISTRSIGNRDGLSETLIEKTRLCHEAEARDQSILKVAIRPPGITVLPEPTS